MTCSFWSGVSRAKTFASSTASPKAASSKAASCGPVMTLVMTMPTSLQTLRVTSSLSPVRIFTTTPERARASMALAELSLAGSKKAM